MFDRAPWVGLSLMPDEDFRVAAYPLFAEGVVDAVEWTFDAGWAPAVVPGWAWEIVDFYAREGRLLGHGVGLSPLSGRWEPRQETWMACLAEELAQRRYVQLSEHFGFTTAAPFVQGPPLPVPFTDGALRVGRDRLARLADLAGDTPVGLENLALAFGPRDVQDQGAFLEALLAPTDGFVVLDLHNLYCQLANFGGDARAALARYPLARVRELHVSGGSWSYPATAAGAGPFRRDTHDEAVPAEVTALVPLALELCPNVRAVIFERLGGTIRTAGDAARMRADFHTLRRLVAECCNGR